MCERIAGELLVCFYNKDVAAINLIDEIKVGNIGHVEIIESLEDRLRKLILERNKHIDLQFYRLRVPEGDEEYKISFLYSMYLYNMVDARNNNQMPDDIYSRPDRHMKVVPHQILSINSDSFTTKGIQLAHTHTLYKELIKFKKDNVFKENRNILILDTGIEQEFSGSVLDKKNFVNPSDSANAIDDNGHGTVIAKIINDLSPSSNLTIYKVADQNGRASEWDTLSALLADHNADIINISLAFGLSGTECLKCGRASSDSRCAVFENVIDNMPDSSQRPIIVSAAGNGSKDKLSYPARFPNVLAIESIDHTYNLSAFSNRSKVSAERIPHDKVFVLFGGQKNENNQITEYVATSKEGKKYCGTSFSAAYATGIISAIWSMKKYCSCTAEEIIEYVEKNAYSKFPSYDKTIHGKGLIQFF
jgi:subtilisin